MDVGENRFDEHGRMRCSALTATMKMTALERHELVAHASAVAFWTNLKENTPKAAAGALGVSIANQLVSLFEITRDLQDGHDWLTKSPDWSQDPLELDLVRDGNLNAACNNSWKTTS